MARVVLILILLAIVGAGGYWLGSEGADDDSDDSGSSLLVVRGEATIEGDTLALANPQVEWFADRPDRAAGSYTPKTVVASWDDDWEFDSEPPNAVLSGSEGVVELANPTLASDGALSFDLTRVEGRLPSGDLGEQALFIDAFPTAVNDQVTD